MTRIKIDMSKPAPPARGVASKRFDEAIDALARAPVGASVFVPHDRPHHPEAFAAIKRKGPSGWATSRKLVEDGVTGIRIWKLAELPKSARAAK